MRVAAGTSATPRRRGFLRARVAATFVAAAALAITLAPPPTATLGAWTDAEFAAGSFTALTVPAPQIDTCVASVVLVFPALLAPRVVLTWHYPFPGYTLSNARFVYSASGLFNLIQVPPANVSTTPSSPTGGGPFTTTYQGGLLGGVLGGQAHVGVYAMHASGWISAASTAHTTFPFVLGPASCTITNAS